MSAPTMAQATAPLDTKTNIATSLRLTDGVELLDTIDKLRELGIDSEIPLPQIVVVGQQSAGKSSVLEALSGIPFPTNDGLCTRFPTEVILRRAAKEKTSVQIVQQSSRSSRDDTYRKSIDKFNSDITGMLPLGVDKLPDVIATASKYLILGNGKDFTRDFLRIEVSGPRQDHLTLVDLPGLFYYTGAGQDPEEPGMVKDLALRYMKEKRSIILAVLSAKGDYKTQEILQTLKGIDPTGVRTMGVITGVDQVERKSSREHDYLRLAENDTVPLALGWHVLRNPSFMERQKALDRHKLEKSFFETAHPWSTIDPKSRGSEQLKRKLSNVLMEHIGSELNEVVATLSQRIEDCEETLSKCGEERLTQQQQRAYLTSVGTEYSRLVKAALEGPYKDPFFRLTGERLRARVRQATEQFASTMAAEGHRWKFVEPDQSRDNEWLSTVGSKTKRIGDQRGADRDEPCSITKVEYLLKVNDILKEYRGRELLGTFDPLLVGVLFQDQAYRWRKLAQDYSRHIAELISRFILRLTEHVTESKRTRVLLAERLRLAMQGRERKMHTRLAELLKPYEDGCPTTYNPLLPDMIKDEQSKSYTNIGDLPSGTSPECDRIACKMLMDHMQAYYNIALRTFVDNVATLGVELCLLDGLEELFSALTIVRMSDEEISKLASESAEDILHRRTTEKRLEKLRAGREVCQRYELPELTAAAPAVIVDTSVDQLADAIDTLEVSRPTTPLRQPVHQSSLEATRPSPGSTKSTSSSKTRSSASTTATTPEPPTTQLAASLPHSTNGAIFANLASKSAHKPVPSGFGPFVPSNTSVTSHADPPPPFVFGARATPPFGSQSNGHGRTGS